MDKQNEIFIKNMKHYINLSRKSQKEIAEAINVPVSTFSTWMVGKALPRMGKVEALANYFGCKKSDLLEENKDYVLYSEKEKLLIENYRNADSRTQELIEKMLLFFNQKEGE